MDAALTPREIQARIRAGASVDELAAETGMTLAQIEPFAGPVLAERAWFASQASNGLVRRDGANTHQSLLELMGDRLANRGLSTADVSWDAWRGHDRLWTIRASFRSGSALHEAVFRYDPTGRFSTAVNDEARWLVGEASSNRSQPTRRPSVRDTDADVEPTLDMAATTHQMTMTPHQMLTPEKIPAIDFEPGDFADAELTQVNGVYELVPSDNGMDVLYDMLASINEESVRIYDGLTGSNGGQTSRISRKTGGTRSTGRSKAAPNKEPEPAEAAPQLPALSEEAKEPTVRIPKSKKRATVPTWDEIMFGSPTVN